MTGKQISNEGFDVFIRLFLIKHPFYYSQFATVKEVTAEPQGDKPGLLTVTLLDKSEITKVRWHWPLKPAPKSNCVVIYMNNSNSQKFAFGFDLIDEIKTKVGNDIDLHLKAGKIDVTCKEMNINVNNAKLVSDGTKFNVTGDFNVDGKVKATKNIESDAEIAANASSAKVTLTQHTHQVTVNPGQVTTCGAGPGATTSPGTGSTQQPTPGA